MGVFIAIQTSDWQTRRVIMCVYESHTDVFLLVSVNSVNSLRFCSSDNNWWFSRELHF